MGTLMDQVQELWNNALLTYRMMVIKAELKKRRAIKNSQESAQERKNELGESCSVLHDHIYHRNCHKYERFGIASGPAAVLSMGKTQNCDCRSELNRVFDMFDANKDGLICANELKQYMKKLGFELSEEYVKDMLATVDINQDGRVDFEEFCSLYGSLCGEGGESNGTSYDAQDTREDAGEEEEEEDLLKAFFIFDRNKDGLICALELQQVLLKLGMVEGESLMCCQKMIERVDSDGNGKVDFFEFKDMMCSHASPGASPVTTSTATPVA